MKTIGHWIGGKAVPGTSGRTTPVYDPARGVQTGQVQLASAAEGADAVKVAVDASRAWGVSTLSARANMFFRLRELLNAHRDDLAAIITAEHGKVFSDAQGEVARDPRAGDPTPDDDHVVLGVLERRRTAGRHRMISSALRTNCGGIVRPRALTVFALMTSSSFGGCWTGRSPGFSPFRILAT